MSGELENAKGDEEETKEAKRSLRVKILDNWQLIFKILELIICAICLGLAYDPVEVTGMGKKYLHHVGVMYTAYSGYMLILSVLIICHGVREKLGYRTSFAFSVCGSVLFFTTGVLLTVDKIDLTKVYFYHPQYHLLIMMTTAIVFSFINAIIFAVDAILTFKRQEDF